MPTPEFPVGRLSARQLQTVHFRDVWQTWSWALRGIVTGSSTRLPARVERMPRDDGCHRSVAALFIPTTPLDSERVLTLIRNLDEMAQRFGTAIIDVTRDETIIPKLERIHHIRDGRSYAATGEARAV
jgi:hypothetical protein